MDLIYLDPPFNKKKVFSAPIGSSAEGAGFRDIFRKSEVKAEWLWQIKSEHRPLYAYINGIRKIGHESNYCYLCYMAVRLLEMHRALKPTGSLYLHCDSTMNSYLRLLLDVIFGEHHYRNEITWKRTSAHNNPSKRLGRVSDRILYYVKSERAPCYPQHTEYDEDYLSNFYRHEDKKGKYRLSDLTGAGANPNDTSYKGYHPGDRGRGWSVPVYKINELVGEEKAEKMTTIEKLKLLDKKGYIHWTEKGTPSYKRYLEDMKGRLLQDVWTDIKNVGAHAKERVGYPTQKPSALLRRIIGISTQAGDWVLDPFCGCATTCVAAEQLGRKWLGIDVSRKAYELVQMRLNKEIGRADDLFPERLYYKERLPNPEYKLTPKERAHIKNLQYGKQDGKCMGCDVRFDKRNLEIDHIVPRALGGDDHPSNLQLLCGNCNRTKGDRPMWEFMAARESP